MRPIRPAVELTPRDREILRDVVQTFILVGEPVSSRSVAKHAGMALLTVLDRTNANLTLARLQIERLDPLLDR